MGSHSARVLEALSSDNIESLCLEKECREQEEYFGTHFIVEILERAECSCMQGHERSDKKMRQVILTDLCRLKAPAVLALAQRVHWVRLWEATLEQCYMSVRGMGPETTSTK